MGCYPPLGKIVSKALGKCNGRERWREGRLDFDYALAYPPGPPTEIRYVRPVARTVTFASNNSIYVIPPSPPPQPQPQPQQQSTPEPQQPQTPPRHEPEQHQDTPESQPPRPQTEQPEQPEPPAQTQDAPPQAEPKPPKGPKRGKKKQPGRVRFGLEPPPPQQQEEQAQQEHAQGPGNIEKATDQAPHGAAPAPAPTQGQGYLLRYTPSPLPRWEATPRRHEYFSGEYRSYYPTPVREGIYRIAADANRLTTIFSEENPNACTIV